MSRSCWPSNADDSDADVPPDSHSDFLVARKTKVLNDFSVYASGAPTQLGRLRVSQNVSPLAWHTFLKKPVQDRAV